MTPPDPHGRGHAPPDEDIQAQRAYRAERSVARVRVAILTLATGVFVWMGEPYTRSLLTWTLVGGAWAYSLLYWLGKPYESISALRSAHVAAVTDSALVGAFVVATGGFDSPFYLVWYVSILGVAGRFGLRGTAATSGVYAAAYVAILVAYGQLLPHLPAVAMRTGMMVLIGLSAGLLAAEAGAQTRRRTVARDERDQLERAYEELREIAYATSHDLQTPLRSVAGHVQLLKRRYGEELDEEAMDYIQTAVDGSVRMQELITDLSTYVRLGTDSRGPEDVDVDPILRRAVTSLANPIEESGAEIVHEEMPRVHAEPKSLLLVFQHLLANALKFRSDEPPRIDVEAHREDEETWRISIHDNGIGFDPRHRERIFHIFTRLHAGDAYQGTGVGLAVCRKIVEQQDGRIWAESSPGEGTTIHFTLPAARPAEPHQRS